MSRLKWLTNGLDPGDKDLGLSRSEEREYRLWLRDKFIGKPKATEAYSIERLEALGMIGVYEEVPNEAIRQDA